MGSGSQTAWIQILALLFTSYVALGKLLNLSVSSYIKMNLIIILMCCSFVSVSP